MTAVEWLVNELDLDMDLDSKWIIEQTKEMEKQQIIDAFDTGFERWNDGAEHYLNSEDYYQKTFKNTNKCGQ